MSPKALVIGSEGFVGKRLCAHLESTGWEVLGASRRVPPDHPARFVCDIVDREQVVEMVRWAAGVTHVFHLAAVSFVPDAAEDPARSFLVNFIGGVNVAQALVKHAPRARFICVTSCGVYGPAVRLPIVESHKLAPVNPYGIGKAALDHYCAWLDARGLLDCVCLRPFNHSGPGQRPDFALPAFAFQIARAEAGLAVPVVRVGNLEPARDFLHVDDVVRAYEAAALRGRAGAAYNVCSGRSWTLREALNRLLAMTSVPFTVEVDSTRVRPLEIPDLYGSHDRLTAHAGWRPEKTFDDLLEDVLAHWRAHFARDPLPPH